MMVVVVINEDLASKYGKVQMVGIEQKNVELWNTRGMKRM